MFIHEKISIFLVRDSHELLSLYNILVSPLQTPYNSRLHSRWNSTYNFRWRTFEDLQKYIHLYKAIPILQMFSHR